jgi:hypothetical protein
LRKRQQGDVAGAFDGAGQLALVSCAGAGLPAWSDLTFFGNETAQHVDLLIINTYIFIGAELADFWARNIAPSTTIPAFSFFV